MKKNSRIASIEQATHQSWDEWIEFMESIQASSLDHHEIATKVLEQLKGKIESPAWWAQSVTVAYEQYSGRRIPGQRPDGTFQMSISKATSLEMKDLMDSWVKFTSDDQELHNMVKGLPKVSGTKNRITWRVKALDDSSIIVTSEPKSNGTASIIATQMGLPNLKSNEAAKNKWQTIISRFINEI